MYSHFEVNVLTKDLLKALSTTNSVVEKRNTLPILGNIKLDTVNSMLQIVATDGDITIVQNLGADIKSNGAVTVSASVLGEIIRKIPDEAVYLKYDRATSQLSVRTQNSLFHIAVIPAEEFPKVDYINASAAITVETRALETLLDTTKFSMSNEETRYNMNGIYLHLIHEEGVSYLASATTDGHRLSVNRAALGQIDAQDDEFGVILPKKTVLELSKILKTDLVGAEIQIRFGTNKCEFNCGNIVVISKLIDGTFPEYHAFIPGDHPAVLNISSTDLAAAVDRVSVVTVDKFRAVKLHLSTAKLDISASGEARGSAFEVVTAKNASLFSYQGDEMKIGFNPRYLLDILGCLGENECTIHLANNTAPALVTSSSMPFAKFVIMPVRI